MTKANFFGNEVEVLEHISEIKDKFKVDGYFNRFYNKKQMFNFFIGKSVFIDEDGHKTEQSIYDPDCQDCYSDNNPCSGSYVNCSDGQDVSINFFEASAITEESDFVQDFEWYEDTFTFVMDDSKQLWLIVTNVD